MKKKSIDGYERRKTSPRSYKNLLLSWSSEHISNMIWSHEFPFTNFTLKDLRRKSWCAVVFRSLIKWSGDKGEADFVRRSLSFTSMAYVIEFLCSTCYLVGMQSWHILQRMRTRKKTKAKEKYFIFSVFHFIRSRILPWCCYETAMLVYKGIKCRCKIEKKVKVQRCIYKVQPVA